MCGFLSSAVCNLASIALPTFIKDGVYDFQKLHEVVKVSTTSFNLYKHELMPRNMNTRWSLSI